MARMGCIGGLSACVISLHTKWVDLRRDSAVTGIQSLYSSFHSLRGTRGARSRRAARVRSPPRSADSMSIRNLAFGTRQPPLSPHTRLALSVVACAVKDIKGHDALLHRSAARFLNGSEAFYFWAQALEQDSNWLLRRLHARLRKDSPRAFRRLSQYSRPQSRTMTCDWDSGTTFVSGFGLSTRRVSSNKTVAPKPATDRALPRDSTA